MNEKKYNILLLGVALLLSISSVFAKEVSGKVISFSCSGCHGTGGLLDKPGMPKLKGQNSVELEKSLLDFKYDRTSSSIMSRISKGFTDSELKNVALYFSQLK